MILVKSIFIEYFLEDEKNLIDNRGNLCYVQIKKMLHTRAYKCIKAS